MWANAWWRESWRLVWAFDRVVGAVYGGVKSARLARHCVAIRGRANECGSEQHYRPSPPCLVAHSHMHA